MKYFSDDSFERMSVRRNPPARKSQSKVFRVPERRLPDRPPKAISIMPLVANSSSE
jgi:hypothetical protein